MFIEVHAGGSRNGWIEVVCGSMFSGKTEELIRRIRRAEIARQQVRMFKPATDTRYSEIDIVSHNQTALPATPVQAAADVLSLAGDAQVVGIDEAQFFDMDLPRVVRILANNGVRVIIAGLDMDFRGNPFGPMPDLLAIAEFVTKVHAICQVCGSLASYSYRMDPTPDTVLLGEKEHYEARCRRCFLLGTSVQGS